MSFLDWPIERNQIAPNLAARRKKMITELLERFGRGFPQISYDLIWKSPMINAQAFPLGRKLHVRIYGGLVRHPAISWPGLLIPAHETGHHLGGAPHDSRNAMPDMAGEGRFLGRTDCNASCFWSEGSRHHTSWR